VQGITSTPSNEVLSTLSNQNANVTDDAGKVADTAPTSDSVTNPDQQTPTETLRTDPAAITEALPPLSSPASTPGRTARRKSSTKTPNTSKARGHSRS